MEDVALNAKKVLGEQHIKLRQPLSLEMVEEQINLIRGMIMIAYPAYHNLPKWDLVYLILENKVEIQKIYPDCEYFDHKTTVLWWAKKELQETKFLRDYIGKNEKTKIILK